MILAFGSTCFFFLLSPYYVCCYAPKYHVKFIVCENLHGNKCFKNATKIERKINADDAQIHCMVRGGWGDKMVRNCSTV